MPSDKALKRIIPKYIQHHSDIDQALSDVIQALTDHFEREAKS